MSPFQQFLRTANAFASTHSTADSHQSFWSSRVSSAACAFIDEWAVLGSCRDIATLQLFVLAPYLPVFAL